MGLPRYDKSLFAIFIFVIVLIVYGSFYPWVFEARQLPASPLSILLHSWAIDFQSRKFVSDVAINIAIYMPLGISGYLAFRRFKSTVLEIAAPIAIGASLSACVEMVQLFTPHRECSAVDLVNNILGTVFGVLAGMLFKEIVDVPETGPLFVARDRVAVALLFVWVAFLLFPLFPVLALAEWRVRIFTFIHGPLFRPTPIFLSAAEWFVVGRLLAATGVKSPLLWLLGLLALVPIQFAIIGHTVLPFDFVGPVLGTLLFVALRKGSKADGIAGMLLLVALTVRGLEPFRFEGPGQAFAWIPFIGLLNDTWQPAISVLLGKLFQYGASLWLLSRSFFGLAGATSAVTLVLAAIEVLQTQIPGHIAEMTDPLIGVLLGLAFFVLRRNSWLTGNVTHRKVASRHTK